MKLYIIGAVASGKSTLARRVAERTGVPCTHLDDVVYMPDPAAPEGNRKRPAEERDRLFQEVLAQKSYIIEDAGRTCFLEGLRQADTVVLLDPPIAVRRRRILTRWVKQNLGLEPCGYRPNFAMLRAMFRWSSRYDTGADGVRGRVGCFQKKTVVLRNNREIAAWLAQLPSPSCK